MKSFKGHISSIEIIWFLVLTLIVGFGIQFLSNKIEMNAQLHFMDYAIGFLLIMVGVKFVTEKI